MTFVLQEPLYNQSNPLTQKTMESQDTQVSAEEMMEIDGAEDVSSDQGALATSTGRRSFIVEDNGL